MLKYKQCEADFEREWDKLSHVYAAMLSAKTLRLVKSLSKTMYVQGRVDGMVVASAVVKGDWS